MHSFFNAVPAVGGTYAVGEATGAAGGTAFELAGYAHAAVVEARAVVAAAADSWAVGSFAAACGTGVTGPGGLAAPGLLVGRLDLPISALMARVTMAWLLDVEWKVLWRQKLLPAGLA